MSESFLFYDLETFGADPRTSRIAQFAAIRTDARLNIIEEPISFFVQPASDLLPSPQASMVTGIAPQDALRDGANEAEAFARIFEAMSQPQTCAVGYNSLRFDDEFVRYGLFRNFYDPYQREWRGGNSRWDLLDVMRLAHALRPQGIIWPQREDGHTSFKLEHLAAANQTRQGDAHEALSDVRALIGLARKLRAAQPKLWEHALRSRDKRHAGSLIDPSSMSPVLHISQRFPASRLHAAAVLPLARHPSIDNRVIVFDLHSDPESLLTLDADAIADRLYIKQTDLPEGETRVSLKEVHLNRCPVLIEWTHLREPDFMRLRMDPGLIAQRALRLREAGSALAEKVRRVFSRAGQWETTDVDASLYSGFIGDADRKRLDDVRATPAHLLGRRDFGFRDPRLNELLFRYRARNWPELLNQDERERWNTYRKQRLLLESGLSELSMAAYQGEIATLRLAYREDSERLGVLDRLQNWGAHIAQELL